MNKKSLVKVNARSTLKLSEPKAKLKNKKERQYKVYLSNPCQANKTLYAQKKQIYEKTLLEKKNDFSTSLFDKYKGDIKKTWSMVNRLLGKTKSKFCQVLKINGVLETDPKKLSNEFNKYFANIAESIKSQLPRSEKHFRDYLPLPSHSTRRSIYFWPTDIYEVKEIIMSS